MKSITHNNRLSLIHLYGYQEKNFKIDIPKITNKFIVEEVREMNKLVYYKFRNIRINTVLDSGLNLKENWREILRGTLIVK